MMSEKQYYQLAEKAKRQYEQALAELAGTWRLIHDSDPPRIGVSRPKTRMVEEQPQLATALLAVLDDMPTEFTTVDIYRIVTASNPENAISRSSVSHTMKRIAEQKNPPITIIEVGRGKRSTRYRKAVATVPLDSLDDL